MLNLEKLNTSKQVILDLVKKKGIDSQKAKVIFCIDYSGSTANLYSQGTIQKVLERLVPLAMAFDDDQTMEVYAFHHNVKRLADVNLKNLDGFVKNEIMSKMSFGATDYSPAISKIHSDFVGDSSNIESVTITSKGMFGFNTKTKTSIVAKVPAFVIFITDGENSDKDESKRLISKISSDALFFQFVGLKTSFSDRFKFLTTLDTMSGRVLDNANFFEITDSNLLFDSDNVLYDKLLNEFPDWVKQAKAKQIIK